MRQPRHQGLSGRKRGVVRYHTGRSITPARALHEAGTRAVLDSNSVLVGWERELDGSAPEWGIMMGKGAAKTEAEWLTGGRKLPVDLSAVLGPVLYRIDWDSGFSARLSILCQDAESAAGLARFLNLWRASQSAGLGTPSGTALAFSDIQVQMNGSRVELSASGTMETLDSIFRIPTSGSAQ